MFDKKIISCLYLPSYTTIIHENNAANAGHLSLFLGIVVPWFTSLYPHSLGGGGDDYLILGNSCGSRCFKSSGNEWNR